MKNRKGRPEMILGLMLLLAALGLAGHNLYTEQTAGITAAGTLAQLEAARLEAASPTAAPVPQATAISSAAAPAPGEASPSPVPADDAATLTAEGRFDMAEAAAAAPTASPVAAVTPMPLLPGEDPSALLLPTYRRDPNARLPVTKVGGVSYIGTLEIPALKLILPIAQTWSYAQLKDSPCRYTGSPYTDDFVLLAHNYVTHFGLLRTLNEGEEIIFIDEAGNRFVYAIAQIETLQPREVKRLTESEWPLTLATCTPGGLTRVTVRCSLVREVPAK